MPVGRLPEGYKGSNSSVIRRATFRNVLDVDCRFPGKGSFSITDSTRRATGAQRLIHLASTHFQFTVLTCAQRTRIPTSARSTGFCVI